MVFLTTALNGLVFYIYYLYGWYRLSGNPLNLHNSKNYIAMIIFILFGTIINVYMPQTMKMILITILIVFLSNWVVFHNIRKSIVAIILIQFITMLSEAAIVFMLNIVFSINIADIMKDNLYCIIINTITTMCNIFLVKLTFTKKVYERIINFTSKLKKSKLIKYSLLMLFFATIFTSMIYINQSFEIVVAVNTIAIVIFCWLALKMTSSEARYDETAESYKTSKALLECTENEMNDYMSDNHEIKKQLQIIEQMVLDKDPSVIDYVQALKKRSSKRTITNDVKNQIEKIPLKLLRYLFKDRIIENYDSNIKFNFYISKRLKKSKFLSINRQDELDINDIVSVFIGNAIAAVDSLEVKEISFELYPEISYICIVISNNYEGYIDLDKISNPGYTTKGKGHGYGLTLVKKIIERNEKLEKETEISKNVFKQILKIKV